MILISYPSGGFGNFLYYALTEFSSNTFKPGNHNFDFDILGRSHQTKKYTKVYFHDPDNYVIDVPVTDLETLILCDNGINNDSYENINRVFPNAIKIRTVIDKDIRPVIYKTCVYKAQGSDPITESYTHINNNWDNSDDYSIRENFSLLYHNWPFKWYPDKDCVNVSLKGLITNPHEAITNLVEVIGGEIIHRDKLTSICNNWKLANYQYFKIFFDWHNIEIALDLNENLSLKDITDLHDQGYLNYCIEEKYNVTIPVYDYKHWFNNTNDILEMIKCLK
jgi:hypothetical protein